MKFFAKIRISQYYKDFILLFVQPAQNPNSNTSDIEQQINFLVYRLYNLTHERGIWNQNYFLKLDIITISQPIFGFSIII